MRFLPRPTMKFVTFDDPFMKKLHQLRLSSVVLLLTFLASAIVGRLVSAETSTQEFGNLAIHGHSELPYNTNAQLPFEEKEKEFEDKDDNGSDPRISLDNYTIICDFAPAFKVSEQTPSSTLLSPEPVDRIAFSPSIFLRDGAFLL
jgi:hypothetical protein